MDSKGSRPSLYLTMSPGRELAGIWRVTESTQICGINILRNSFGLIEKELGSLSSHSQEQ